MQEITVYDINGDVLRNLVQWDINIKICIKEPAIDKAYKVHFFNLKSSEALVVESEFSNGVLSAIIPTILLMEPYPITGYIYFEKNNEHKSVYCFTFSMRKRPKPANYVYNNEKNYFTFEEVLAEAKEYALNALNYATESRSYARGDTGTRPGETTDSALYYYNQSKASAEASKVSETNSAKYAENAKNSADTASASASTAQRLANEAEISANNSAESASVAIQKASEASDSASKAKQSETNSKASETAAGVSEANAAESEANALTYKNEAKTSETNAKASEIAAALSQKNALASENAAKVSEDNSKTSEENSKISETNASVSETNAKISETNSKKSEENAKNSELKALVSQDAAKKSEDNAQISESNALTSAQTATDLANIASTKAEIATAAASSAKIYESNATDSALAAEVSATEAANSANEANTSKASAANSALEASDNATLSAQKAIEAKDSAENAAASEANAQIIKETVETYVEEAVENATIATEKAQEAIDAVDSIGDSVDVASQKAKEALDSANLAKSYSTGTDGQIREDDNVDCAKYYYEQSKKISQGFNGVIPMGTITFDGLDDESNQQPGYMFNISDSFISDERFNDGGGIFYGAGNNLMFTADGKWDVFASSMVSGVKGEAESEYRQGFVNITPANIGLEKVPNVSTNDQTPTFTQATTRANIASGEKLSVIFGKIMKWFVDIKSVAFSGSYNDLLDKPTSLPANGGTAETISEILPIEKGGTGGNTKKAVNDIVATGSDISDPATFSENDRFLWVFNGSSVIKSKFVTLIKYIESKLASVASSGSYNDLTDKPTTMKNPKALIFNGGSFLSSYDGSVEKTINLPSTLPANGGTAQTISDTLPIEKGGTGQTTAKDALRALVEGTEDGTSTPTDNDWYLCQTYNGGANDQSVVRRKTISLWSYIKSKCDALFLKLSGGTMSGTINSSKTTGTYLAGNQGQAIINSTAAANTYTMLDKLNSTNGVFTDGVYQNKRLFQYTAKSTVDAGTNAVTKSVTLLDEDGNTKFPGTVTAPRFAGTADVATVSKQGKSYIVGSNSGNAPTKPWYKVAECSITSSFVDPTCVLLVHDSYSGNSRRFIGMIKVHFRSNEPPTGDTSVVDLTWIFKTYQLPENLFGLVRTNITNGVKFTLYINISAGNYHSFDISVLSNTSRDTDGHYFIFADNLKANGDLASITPTGNTQVVSSGYGYLVANKLGTATVGAVSRPIYLNGGTPTPIGNKFSLADGITSQEVIQLFDDGDTANNGGNLLIRGGRNLFIGSGESPEHLHNALKSGNIKFPDELWTNSGEECYITSDGNIYLYANCQTIANRKGLRLHSPNTGYSDFSPLEDRAVNLGRSDKKFENIYANRLYGTATSATKLGTTGYIEENSRATTDEGIRIRPFRNALDALIMSIGNNGNSPSASNYEEIVAFTIGNNYLDSDARCFLQYRCTPNNSSVSDNLIIGRANGYVTRELTMGLVCETVEARSHSNSSGWAPIYAASFDKVSSRKYKEDIEDINEDEANKVLDIRIVSFKYKDDKGKRKQFGCIAEEVVDVIESAVTYKNGEVNGVDYSSFVPHLIKMTQMHEATIRNQAEEIAELKSTISDLNDRIQRLEDMVLR